MIDCLVIPCSRRHNPINPLSQLSGHVGLAVEHTAEPVRNWARLVQKTGDCMRASVCFLLFYQQVSTAAGSIRRRQPSYQRCAQDRANLSRIGCNILLARPIIA